MRSFVIRSLAAVPVVCLFIALCEDSQKRQAPHATVPAPHAPNTPDTDPEPEPPETVSVDHEREDARAELDEIRHEIEALDRTSGRAFSRTLNEVLLDPSFSRLSRDGNYRLPAGEGMDRLDLLLPEIQRDDPQAFQERWAFLAVAAVIASSRPDKEIDNYLALDSQRSVRRFLFPD